MRALTVGDLAQAAGLLRLLVGAEGAGCLGELAAQQAEVGHGALLRLRLSLLRRLGGIDGDTQGHLWAARVACLLPPLVIFANITRGGWS